MGHLPVIDDVYRVTLAWSPIASANPANVMHFSMATGDESDIAAGLDASWENGMFGCVSSSTSVIRYDVLKLDGTSPTRFFVPDPANSEGLDGQAGGDPAMSMAVCVAFQTDFRGPANRGRIYLGPISESEISGSELVGVDTAVIAAQWQTFNDNLVGLGTPILHGVASYKHHTFHGISGYRCDTYPTTQRRRLTASRA
jgi:hypothetical protein